MNTDKTRGAFVQDNASVIAVQCKEKDEHGS